MSYSHSSIKSYEECPFKYRLTRIEHKHEPSGPAADRGKMIHTEFENLLKGMLQLYTAETEYWEPFVNELVAKNAMSELEIGIDKDWKHVPFSDKNVWVRGIFDIFYIEGNTAYVGDWKTGKERDYLDQLKLYASFIFAAYPFINEVRPEILFVDLKKRQPYKPIPRSQFDELKAWVNGRVSKIENDDIFAPKPSGNCRYCHFRKNNGGPCQW